MSYVVQWVAVGGVVPPELVEEVCDADRRLTSKTGEGLALTMEIVRWGDTPGNALPNLNQ